MANKTINVKGSNISQDSTHRLVTDTEKSTWNGKANSSHTHSIANITNLQTSLDGKAPKSHTHTKSQITDFPTIPTTLKNPNSIVIKLNGGSTEGTNMFTYDGSTARSINITPAGIGAATSGHTHAEIANLDNTYLKLSGGTVTGSILPSVSDTCSLGSSSNAWKYVYTSRLACVGIFDNKAKDMIRVFSTNQTYDGSLGSKIMLNAYGRNTTNSWNIIAEADGVYLNMTVYDLKFDTDGFYVNAGTCYLGTPDHVWSGIYSKQIALSQSAEDNTDVTFETHKLNSTTDTDSYVGANYTGYIEDSLEAQYNIQYVSNVNGDSYQYDILSTSNASLQIGGKIKCNNSWTDRYIDIYMNGNVIPAIGRNLGDLSNKWNTVYTKNLTTNAILSFGAQGVTVTATGASNNWYDHASLAVMPDGIINSVPIKSNVVLGADKSLTEELSLINLKNMKASDGHIGLNIKTQKTKTTPAEPSLKFNFVYANGKSGDDAIDVEENILTVTKSAYLNDYEVTLSNINTFTISKVCEITTNISYPFIEPLSSSASFGSSSKSWYNGYFTNLYTSGISAQGSGLNFFKCDTIFFYCSQTTGSSRQWYLSGDSAVIDRIYFKKGSTTYQTEYTYNENGYSIVYGLDIGIKLDVSSKAFSPYKLINAPELSLGQSKSKWTYVYATNGTIQTSNELKKNILGSITEKYENLFMKLEPIMFTWNNETADGNNHDRIHLGLGAQTTKKHMDECNISAEEYALYCEDTVEETDENGNIINTTEYGINYGQLHGLEVHMIQKLKKENDELKDRITKLEELVNSLVK